MRRARRRGSQGNVTGRLKSAGGLLRERETLTLSARDRDVLIRALLSPPTPSGRLARAIGHSVNEGSAS
jgi:hypothetical protein